MREMFSRATTRVRNFFSKNPALSCVFFFFLISGAAAGAKSVSGTYDAAQSLVFLPARFHVNGVPFLHCALVSICVNGLFFCAILLSGIFLPVFALLPISVFLRGVLTGTALALITQALPSAVSMWLMFFLLIDTAFMLPALLGAASVSKELFMTEFRRIFNKGASTPENAAELYKRAFISLLPCVLIESVAAPLAIYLFC